MTSISHLDESFQTVLRNRTAEPLIIAPSESLTLTAADIDRQAGDLAALISTRLAAGHVIVASVGNRAVMPAVVLASLRRRWPLMPVDRSTPPAELLALATRWDAAAVIVPADMDLTPPADGLETGPVRERHALPHGLAMWVTIPAPAPGRYGPAVLLKLTSGSTGEPRATCSEERHLIADVRHIAEAMDIGPRTRQLGIIPLSHSYGFSNLLLPVLWMGTPLLLRPQFVPTQIATDIRDASLETCAGVPFMFDHLARHQQVSGLDSLRLVLSAGARLSFETVTAFHAATGLKVRSFYGSSETGGICFDDSDALDPRVPVGRPLGATTIDLVDDEHAPAGSGRVRVSGPNVIDRYAGDDGPGFGGVYVTGDYARVDNAGAYELTGRVPSVVNVAGRKVQPQEVEAAVKALPGIRDAIAIGVDDAVRGQALGVCVVSDEAWDARTIRAALAPRLAPHKLPRLVVVTRALPLTDRGKVDRAAIARLLTGA